MRPPARSAPFLALAALAASLGGCAGAPPSGAVPGDSGARLLRAKCTACHRAYPPEERTRSAWAEVMTRMARKAHLSEGERADLLGWLQGHAKDAAAPAGSQAGEGAR